MRHFYFPKRLWLALLLLSVAVGGTHAQWKIVAPHAVKVKRDQGVMTFNRGVVWIADDSDLFMSTDSGTSWSDRGPLPSGNNYDPKNPFDIAFMSPAVGVLATFEGEWITHDAGTSWQPLTTSPRDIISTCFLNNVNSIALAREYEFDHSGKASGSVTIDGGTTWREMPGQNCGFCVRYKNGIIYEFGGDSTGAHIISSSDFGLTWQQSKAGIDWDSFSFAIDSCDPNRIYLSHEDVVAPTDQFSKIFLTTNRGDTWQTIVSHPLPFFSGSIAEGNSAVYCQTTASGVFRSVDKGMTWTSIGGPSMLWDTRLIAAINDNILIGVDSGGNVWRTYNSGGDSIASSQNYFATTLLTPSQPVILNQTSCTPADTSISLAIGVWKSNWSAGLALACGSLRISDCGFAERTTRLEYDR